MAVKAEIAARSAAYGKPVLAITFGVVTAYVVAVALGGAFRDSEMGDVLVSLALPPTMLYLVYQGSEKRFIYCVASLLASGLCFGVSPSLGIPRAGLSLVLMAIGSMAIPVLIDLMAVDMGRQIQVARPLCHTAQIAFLLTLLPLVGWELWRAHDTALREDRRLVGELAAHLTAEGDSLVVDQIDAKTGDRAVRRLAIRTKDKTYPLSDAALESVRETRTVRKTTHAGGTEATEVTREQEERLRLILKLQSTGIPEDVVLFSRRGPLTIYEAKVPLAKGGS